MTTFKIGNVLIPNQVVLAPMAGYSNTSFRKIIKKMGAGLVFAEMVSDKALTYGNEKTLRLLKMDDEERPIAQQIFGSDVDTFVEAAKIVEKVMCPDIIDINMGCPVPKVALAAQAGSATEVEGVNNKVQLARLERAYQRQNALNLMKNGVTLLDPDRIDIRGELVCGKDVEIDVGCIFIGKVKLADGVKVGAYCTLKDVEINAETEILPYCHFDGAKVGKNVRLGPYSRLRPGAVLADETHIGNFVEIKKSNIGFASKVNHLSYIGDTDMGSRVNIGAGTITCNYDGVNKFRTTIGDDAFIGSDTQLVAPVTVGKGATLGAGTTLTKNAPDDKLTLSRARQVTIEGWKRPVKKK